MSDSDDPEFPEPGFLEMVQSFREALHLDEVRVPEPLTVDEITTTLDDEALVHRVEGRLFERFGVTEPVGAGLSDPLRAFEAAAVFEGEWGNGGIVQYVHNQDEYAEASLAIVIEGYELMDLPMMALVAAEALRTAIDERGLRAEVAALGGVDGFISYAERSALNDLDDDVIPTVAERAAFVRAHAAEFAG